MKSKAFLAIFIVCSLILSGCGPKPADSQRVEQDTVIESTLEGLFKIDIASEPELYHGNSDLSLEYGPDGVGYMTYTKINAPNADIYLAKTVDRGKTWEFVTIIAPSFEDTTRDKKGSPISGSWMNEVSTLLYDPEDTGKEWKVYWNKYFFSKPYSNKKNKIFGQGWIAYKYASDPEGEWSQEQRLFPMRQFIEDGDGVDISTLDPSLKEYVYFSELGSVVIDGTIYLSMDISKEETGLGSWRAHKIILLSSDDHGQSWNYRGVLTDHDDAKDFGYTVFTASSLVEVEGEVYLLTSPSGKRTGPNQAHDGIYVFAFEDLQNAQLQRDQSGKLEPVNYFGITFASGGMGDFDEENTAGGVVIFQRDNKYYPEVFQLFGTGEELS